MFSQIKPAAFAAAVSVLALASGCGGGGGDGPAPPPPPVNNRAPTLTTTSVSTNEDVIASAQLVGTDPDNNPVTFALATNPQHGTATLTSAGVLSYTPAPNYSGGDSLGVTVSDGLSSTVQVVNIDVMPLQDAPAAHDDTLRVAATQGQPVAVPALMNDVDVDGDALTPVVVTQPRGGTMTVHPTTRQLIFEPANDYLGPIEFTYRVNDGSVDSSIATVRALIGDFQGLMFLSDYTTPGVSELHLFDGFNIRRISDDLPAGSTIINYSVAGDLTQVAYVVDSSNAMRVYVKPLDGSGAAVLRYTSAFKSVPTNRSVYAYLNANSTYMSVTDQWSGPAKQIYVVNVATGAATQVAGLMPGLVDVRFAIFHPFEPNLVMVQGQTSGSVPRDSTYAGTAFLGDASDMRTLTQIGRTYDSGEIGSGEGFYFGRDPRYIYYGELRRIGNNFPVNLLAYDRVTHLETPLVRTVLPPDRGMSGSGWWSPDSSRLCFPFYEPTTTTIDGPSRYYALDMGNPASATAVTGPINDVSLCTFASDNRTVIYRVYTPGRVTQQAYAVDSSNPGVPRLLAPASEVSSELGLLMFAHDAMRGSVAYFDNNGNPGTLGVGRNYLIPLDGNGTPFLFSDNFVLPGVSSGFYDLNGNGSFLIYARSNGAISNLEIMSTHVLNYSIPLSRNGEILGVRRASWLQRYP
jgi:hypothetical protein